MDTYSKIVLTVAALALVTFVIMSRRDVVAAGYGDHIAIIFHDRWTGTACVGQRVEPNSLDFACR